MFERGTVICDDQQSPAVAYSANRPRPDHVAAATWSTNRGS
jgi:hypothetical protein